MRIIAIITLMAAATCSKAQERIEKLPVAETRNIFSAYAYHHPSEMWGMRSGAGRRTSGRIYFIDGVQVRVEAYPAWFVTIVKELTTTHQPETFLGKERLSHMPYTNIRDIASTLPNVVQSRRGDEIFVKGY